MTFPKSRFPATFGGHLEFLHKTQNVFISEMERDGAISTKFLTCRLYAESTDDVLQNNIFPPPLAAILNSGLNAKTCLSQKWSEIEQFDEIFDPRGSCRVYW